jgi:hypothetical protein
MPCMSHQAPPRRFPAYHYKEDDPPSIVVFTGTRPSSTTAPGTRYQANHSVNFYSHKEHRYDAPPFVENVGVHSPSYDGHAATRDLMCHRQYQRNQIYPSMVPSWSHHSPSKICSLVDPSLLRNPASFQSPYFGYRRFPRTSPLPDDFLPPTHHEYSSPSHTHVPPSSTEAAKVTPLRSASSKFSPESPAGQEGLIGDLRDNDIVCGRGAPTSFQKGNHEFRKLVSEYQTVYLCSKRSDKPKIAMEVMKVLKSREARFVCRVKTSYRGRFCWEEIDETRAYEKVCQALREGGAEFRQKMLACVQPEASENDGELENGKKKEGRSRKHIFLQNRT